ncbi:MAG: GTPase domain-containing protein [Microcella pacifica]|uniref:GTPase domain-containing protein n=1 Tax=Microcella pacifica TaxID=2591847 RepID=A0A9E5MIV2_9MICO|nr:GTPase domain-containing protein [Microcella pacifica]NHF63303.1 GTPase domain-containing protein [Microcella pacifica]
MIIVAAAVAFSAVGAAGLVLAINRLLRFLANKKLTILGAQRVGKTTLFQTLRDGKPPKRSKYTVDPEPGMEFTLRLKGKDVRFAIPKDMPGHDGVAFPTWRAAFESSDQVWYLFRADLIASGDVATIQLVTSHLTLLKVWLKSMSGPKPSVLLVGTFADQVSDYSHSHEDVLKRVADCAPIKAGQVQLNNAELVVGSLANARMATTMVKTIERAIS